MSDLRACNREFLTEFIDLYKSHPCLWKLKSKDYVNKHKKKEAYKALLHKLRQVQPDATLETVKCKINTLRGGFRREYKKVTRSERADPPEEKYVSGLWYYQLMFFVNDQETSREADSNMDDGSEFYSIVKMEDEETESGGYAEDPLPSPECSFEGGNPPSAETDDEYSIFGKIIASKMRSLPREARLYTEKLINDVLFEAQVADLNRSSAENQ